MNTVFRDPMTGEILFLKRKVDGEGALFDGHVAERYR